MKSRSRPRSENGLPEHVIQKIHAVFGRYPQVEKAVLYGSRAKGAYESGEDRYVEYLWRAFRMVHDIDDTRKTDYGVYYKQKKPLNAAALEWREKNKKPGI